MVALLELSLPLPFAFPFLTTHTSSKTTMYSLLSTPKRKTPLPHLQSSLPQVTEARGIPYAETAALIVHYEDDDTHGAQDALDLQETLQDIFDISSTICVLPRDQDLAKWNLTEAMRSSVMPWTERRPDGRQYLFVLAYIGRGSFDKSKWDEYNYDNNEYGELEWLSASGDQAIQWEGVNKYLFGNALGLDPVDILGILDCCYAAPPRQRRGERVSKVLAACGPKERSRSRCDDGLSLVRRIGRAARALQDQGLRVINLETLFAQIQYDKGEAPNAVMDHFCGIRPIALSVRQSGPAGGSQGLVMGSRVLRPGESMNVLAGLTVEGSCQEVTGWMVGFLAGLPGGLRASLVNAWEVEGSAVLVLVRMNWETWARLSAAVDLEILGVVKGPALVHNAGDAWPAKTSRRG